MLRNYLLIAWRNLMRNRRYTFLNLLGLSAGLASFMLIWLFMQDELSFDRFHHHADRIYRLVEIIDKEGHGEASSSNPFPTGPALQAYYPAEIESVVRLFDMQIDRHTLAHGDRQILREAIFFADSNFFELFDFPLIMSLEYPDWVLQAPNTMVLTSEVARALFGSDSAALGQCIRYEDRLDLRVTGIMAPAPAQSHFHFNGLISFSSLSQIYYVDMLNRNWQWNPNWTYLKLRAGTERAELEATFPRFVQKYYPKMIRDQVRHYLQPLTSIHLDSNLEYEIEPNGSRQNLYLFGMIGLSILLIACINFMNLATARSSHRAREVGLRKAVGAFRGQLMQQFLGESLLVSLVGAFFSLLMASFMLPVFEDISGKTFTQAQLLQPGFLAGLLLVALVVGLLAGLYPAFYLSSFQPVRVLKGRLRLRTGDRLFRKALVMAQFLISLILIISTLTIWQQYQHLRTADLGFAKDQIVVIPTKHFMGSERLQEFRNSMCSGPWIENTTIMNEILGVHHNIHEYVYFQDGEKKWAYFPSLIVDEEFVETFRIKLIQGEDFLPGGQGDETHSVLVNEALVKAMGWECSNDAIGKRFSTFRGQERIKGVLENFHFVSLRDSIQPFILDISNTEEGRYYFARYIAVRTNARNHQEVKKMLAYLETKWNEIVPNHPFDSFFLNRRIDQLYAREDQLTTLIGYFSLMALGIACLGLFALAAYTAEQRNKEIGIRKVLGASDLLIARIMTREFAQLILLAIPFAWALAAYFLDDWLESFADPVRLDPLVFVVSSLGVMAIALLTVLLHVLRAANANPVRALRDE